MKPAAFEYHAPTSVDEAVGLLAELGDEAKVLAGGQSLVPLLALRLAVFEHLVDVGRIAESGGHRAPATGRCGSAPARPRPPSSAAPRSAAAVPLLARATPFIGHVQIRNRGTRRRLARPRRPGRRVPGGGAGARRGDGGALGPGPAHDPGRRVLHRPVEHEPRARRAARRRVRSRPGPGGAGARSRSSPAATATSPSPAPSSASSSTATTGSGAAPSASSAWGRRRCGRPTAEARRHRHRGWPTSTPPSSGRAAVAGLDDVPADLHGSAAYRRRVGAVDGRPGLDRGRRRRHDVGDVEVRLTVNGRATAGDGRAPADPGRLPAGALRAHRHPPRLRARRVRRVHGAARRRGRPVVPRARRAGRRAPR